MNFNPEDPFNPAGQLSAEMLRHIAEQASMAQGVNLGGGNQFVTPMGATYVPEVPEASSSGDLDYGVNQAFGTYNLTTDNAFESTGLYISFTEAGTYLILGQITGRLATTADDAQLRCRMYNTTTSALAGPSEIIVVTVLSGTGVNFAYQTAPLAFVYAVTAASTVMLQAARTGTVGDMAASIMQESSFNSTISWLRLGD